MRARYYDPAIGRFISQDSVRYSQRSLPTGSVIDPLSLNYYTYSANNPVMYCDPSGYAWETVFDVVGIIWSVADLCMDPSLANLANLGWDIAATFIPFVPGSYVSKAGKFFIKSSDNWGDIVKAYNKLSDADRLAQIGGGVLVAPYKYLKKMAKGLGLEVHHLIEKRFANKLGINPNDILSIAIDKDTHRKITNAMRDKIGYWNDNKDITTASATPQEIWNALREVYTDLGLTDYLDEIQEQFIDAGHDLNWGEW